MNLLPEVDAEGPRLVQIHCTESELRFLNAPGSMLATAEASVLADVQWLYLLGNGAILQVAEEDVPGFLRLVPRSEPEQSLLGLLWSTAQIETIKENMLAPN